MSIKPFQIDIPQVTLDDLRERLARTRWPDEIDGAGWDYGTNLTYLKALATYWQNEFDWRAAEKQLNQFAQFRSEIDGLGLHFIHERGKGPNPTPLLLVHGWPDSFYRFYKLIPLLTDPASYGGDPIDAFDVVVPSLPGFGFSDRPHTSGATSALAANRFATLMTALGYERFGMMGGDLGSRVTRLLAIAHPGRVLGVHLTDVGYPGDAAFSMGQPTEADQAFLGRLQSWWMQEGAYNMVQSTRPQTLSYGLNDSPVGLAGWIIEKFRAWSDCDGEIEQRFTKDELLTNLTIYWVTETIGSSVRAYREDGQLTPALAPGEHIEVPVGVAHFPKELLPRREMAEGFLCIDRWTEMPTGGHFAALEEPQMLAEDVRMFFRNHRV